MDRAAAFGRYSPPRTAGREDTGMQSAFFHLTTLATLAVLAVLIAGLWTMMRGDSPNLSQKLMRWRVGLQFLALVIIMVFVFLTRGI